MLPRIQRQRDRVENKTRLSDWRGRVEWILHNNKRREREEMEAMDRLRRRG